MPDSAKKWRRATFIYWLLLVYIIAALVWWFISLNKQNTQMRDFELGRIRSQVDSTSNKQLFQAEKLRISTEYERHRSKYVGEGAIFLLLILIGAGFVYRSVRRQLFIQQQQQNFMMAVTHELKTPIAVTRLNLETLQKYHLDPEKQKKLIRTTLDETARLNFLTNNILVSSQLEGRRYNISKDELDLSDLLKDCLRDFRKRFPEREFNELIETDADVKGDPLLLQMLINNLLENAIKYSPRDTPINASLRIFRSGIELIIADEGPGIDEAEKKKIFSKFYRVGNEATRKTQGTGLGLYLCRIIARDHNADISVTNNAPRGSKFAVIFHT